jgi:hypothetical protein
LAKIPARLRAKTSKLRRQSSTAAPAKDVIFSARVRTR